MVDAAEAGFGKSLSQLLQILKLLGRKESREGDSGSGDSGSAGDSGSGLSFLTILPRTMSHVLPIAWPGQRNLTREKVAVIQGGLPERTANLNEGPMGLLHRPEEWMNSESARPNPAA